MTAVESRLFPSVLEVRAGGDGRTISGLVVPFGEVFEAGQLRERFVKGSFARTIAERGPSRVKLLQQHDEDSFPIGAATVLREDSGGLYGHFRIATTPRGDEALALIKDGILDGLSVGFIPIASRNNGGVTERTEVSLRHVGLVDDPAYNTARVHSIRSASTPSLHPSVAMARLRLASIV